MYLRGLQCEVTLQALGVALETLHLLPLCVVTRERIGEFGSKQAEANAIDEIAQKMQRPERTCDVSSAKSFLSRSCRRAIAGTRLIFEPRNGRKKGNPKTERKRQKQTVTQVIMGVLGYLLLFTPSFPFLFSHLITIVLWLALRNGSHASRRNAKRVRMTEPWRAGGLSTWSAAPPVIPPLLQDHLGPTVHEASASTGRRQQAAPPILAPLPAAGGAAAATPSPSLFPAGADGSVAQTGSGQITGGRTPLEPSRSSSASAAAAAAEVPPTTTARSEASAVAPRIKRKDLMTTGERRILAQREALVLRSVARKTAQQSLLLMQQQASAPAATTLEQQQQQQKQQEMQEKEQATRRAAALAAKKLDNNLTEFDRVWLQRNQQGHAHRILGAFQKRKSMNNPDVILNRSAKNQLFLEASGAAVVGVGGGGGLFPPKTPGGISAAAAGSSSFLSPERGGRGDAALRLNPLYSPAHAAHAGPLGGAAHAGPPATAPAGAIGGSGGGSTAASTRHHLLHHLPQQQQQQHLPLRHNKDQQQQQRTVLRLSPYGYEAVLKLWDGGSRRDRAAILHAVVAHGAAAMAAAARAGALGAGAGAGAGGDSLAAAVAAGLEVVEPPCGRGASLLFSRISSYLRLTYSIR